MKFSLRFLLLEVTLIAICLAVHQYRPAWIGGESFYLHAFELTALTTVYCVSLCAAIGGLWLRPGFGAIVGLIFASIFTPIVLLGSTY